MNNKGLLGWVVNHSFGLIKDTGQAAVVLLVVAILLLAFSVVNSKSEKTLSNDNPHPVGSL